MDTLARLARFISALDAHQLPQPVVRQTQRVIMDTLGVAIAGQRLPEVAALTALLANGGSCRVFGTERRADCGTAALLNTTAAVSLELDEGHAEAKGHPGAHVVPVALAIGQEVDADGPRLIASVLAGYEVAVRLGASITLPPMLGAHGSWTVVAGAAAAAKMFQLDDEKTEEALLISFLMMSPALGPALVFDGFPVRNALSGTGARNSIVAAKLAASGYRAPKSAHKLVVENALGGEIEDAGILFDDGQEFKIISNYFKDKPACRHINGALDLIEKILSDGPIPPDSIEAIEVVSYDTVAKFDSALPRNSFAARFSLPVLLAARILGLDLLNLDESQISDPRLLHIAKAVRVRSDHRSSSVYPAQRLTKVTIELNDGSQVSAESAAARGDPADPLLDEDLVRKFTRLTSLDASQWESWFCTTSVRDTLESIQQI